MKNQKNKLNLIIKQFPQIVKTNLKASYYSYYKIGGPIKCAIFPRTIDELQKVIKTCYQNNIKYYVLGNTSNILFSDKAITSLLIFTKSLQGIQLIKNNILEVEAGCTISKLLQFSMKKRLGGLEFLAGIPGTIGGAIASNAGLKNEFISEITDKVEVLDNFGKVSLLPTKKLNFKYRYSNINQKKQVVTKVQLKLNKSTLVKIRNLINSYLKLRKQTQPNNLPNIGSIFRNPKGYFAGKILEQLGFKGKRIGAAVVSEKHANFILNTGKAKARDVLILIKIMQKKVKQVKNIKLETEVVMIGFN